MNAVGFTGTGKGMDARQKEELNWWLAACKASGATEFHHGDCVGADAEADAIARALGYKVVVHPPDDPKSRAFCAQKEDVVWQPLPYLERNHDIVDETERLIAAPRGPERLRSGTWATVRYARKAGRPISILPREHD